MPMIGRRAQRGNAHDPIGHCPLYPVDGDGDGVRVAMKIRVRVRARVWVGLAPY